MSPNAITAVTFLGLLEEKLGDGAGLCVHRETMGRMMEASGGLESLRYDPRYSLACETEMGWALNSGYTVIPYKAARRCRRRSRSKAMAEMEAWHAEGMPRGWRELDEEAKLSSDMVWTVVQITEGLQGKAQDGRRQTAFRKFDYYWDAFPYLHISYTEDLTLEELLEMAILLYCSHTIAPRSPAATTHWVSRRMLTKHLPVYAAHSHSNMSQSVERAVLWMLMLTLYAWEMPSKDPEGEGAKVMEHLPLASVKMFSTDEVEEVLRAFFWTEDFLAFGRRRWSLLSSGVEAIT